MLTAEVEKGHMLSAEVEKGHMLSAEVEKGQMLASHNTKYTADSIEACPYERDSWLCATYQVTSEVAELATLPHLPGDRGTRTR